MNKAVKVRKSLNIKNMKMKCRTKQTFHSHFYSDFSIKKVMVKRKTYVFQRS